MYEPAVVVVM